MMADQDTDLWDDQMSVIFCYVPLVEFDFPLFSWPMYLVSGFGHLHSVGHVFCLMSGLSFQSVVSSSYKFVP